MELKPYSKNGKKHPEKQLKALAAIVKEVGWRQPVLVNQEGVIVAGHGRYFAWQQYGVEYNLKPLWVMDDKGQTIHGAPEEAPLTSEQEVAYRLADNRLNESEWDMKVVIEELHLLDTKGLDVNLTGFDRDVFLGGSGNGGGEGGGGLGGKKEVTCPECGFAFDPKDEE